LEGEGDATGGVAYISIGLWVGMLPEVEFGEMGGRSAIREERREGIRVKGCGADPSTTVVNSAEAALNLLRMWRRNHMPTATKINSTATPKTAPTMAAVGGLPDSVLWGREEVGCDEGLPLDVSVGVPMNEMVSETIALGRTVSVTDMVGSMLSIDREVVDEMADEETCEYGVGAGRKVEKLETTV